MLIIIALLAATSLFIVLYVLVMAYSRKDTFLKNRLRDLNVGTNQKPVDMYWREQMKRSLYDRTVKPFADKIAAKLSHFTPASLRAQAEELVDNTNSFNGMGMTGFMLLLGGSTVFFALLGIWMVYSKNMPFARGLLTLLSFIGAGVFLPFFILRRMVEQRQEAIRQSMPDVLDLLCVSV